MGMQRNRAARQAEAKERAAVRASISDAEQLARLDAMFGKGQGAKKERARLQARIEAGSKSAPKSSKKSKKK